MITPSDAACAPADESRGIPAMKPEGWLRMARGFSCMFWGLPLALLLLSGTVEFRLMPRLRFPAFIAGLLLMFLGVLHLNRVPPLTPRWPQRVRRAMLVLLVLVYLSPFVYWWRAMPHVPYYGANMVALLAATMWGFLCVNRLAAEVGRAFGDRLFAAEAWLCGWLAVLFLVFPGSFTVVRALMVFLPLESTGWFSLLVAPYLLPRWMYALVLLPFTLTMMILWRAKEMSLRAIRRPAPA